jgi:hypothetical protein
VATGNSIDPPISVFRPALSQQRIRANSEWSSRRQSERHLHKMCCRAPSYQSRSLSAEEFHTYERTTLQPRLKARDLLNTANTGMPMGNVFSEQNSDAADFASGVV